MKSSPLFRRSLTASRGGFTLFEMLMVLTIIALLMGFVIFKLSGVTGKAEEKKAEGDILMLREALSAYQLESGTLPTTEQGLKVLWSKPTVEPIPEHWSKTMDEEVLDPWGHPYQYLNPGKHNPDGYDLWSLGPDGLPDTGDEIGNWHNTSSSNAP